MSNDAPNASDDAIVDAVIDPPTVDEAEAALPADDPATRIAALEQEVAELRDRLLRGAADFENFRRRARKESEEAAGRGREVLLKDLLAVADNLERALSPAATSGTVEALAEGVRLVERQLHTVMEKYEVRRFDALHEVFDPTRHDAVQQLATDETPPGTVAAVFAAGYKIGDRLLRAAMVAVAKAPPSPPPPGDGEAAG